MGGNDTTVGKGGNDVYFYADGWGQDTLGDSGGVETLDLSAVTADLEGSLCPELPQVDGMEFGGQIYESGPDPAADRVDFGSKIENARMGSGDDIVYGCSGTNGLSGGAGNDVLADLGGFDLPNNLDPPKSDDRYRGFQVGSGNDVVVDAGGRADVFDLRAFRSGDVELYRFDFAATSFGGRAPEGIANSLLIKTGEDNGVGVANFFAPDYFATYNGRVEKILLKDRTISPKNAPPVPDPDTQPIAGRGSMARSGARHRVAGSCSNPPTRRERPPTGSGPATRTLEA